MGSPISKKILIATVVFFVSHLSMDVGFVYAQTEPASKSGYVDTHAHLNARSKPGGSPQAGDRKAGLRRGSMEQRSFSKGTGPKMPREGRGESSTAANYDAAAKQLLAEMDKYGIEKAVIMPPPQIPRRNAGNYQDLVSLPSKYPGRIYFLGGGDVLNKLIHQYKPEQVTPAIRAEFEKKAEEIINAGAKGFGEMAALHLSLISSHHAFEEAAPDHPLFLQLADIAASHNVPIDFHMEAVPADMKLPEGLNRNSDKNPSMLHANIPAFERLLDHNKTANIVWQHIGWDNTGAMTVDLLRRLLEAHPNLYLSMRGEERIFDRRTGQLKPNGIVDKNRKVRPEWLKLISDFPDRFMAGTDDFFGSAISTSGGKSLPTTSKQTWGIVNQLPPELAEKVGRDNAARVYNLL